MKQFFPGIAMFKTNAMAKTENTIMNLKNTTMKIKNTIAKMGNAIVKTKNTSIKGDGQIVESTGVPAPDDFHYGVFQKRHSVFGIRITFLIFDMMFFKCA